MKKRGLFFSFVLVVMLFTALNSFKTIGYAEESVNFDGLYQPTTQNTCVRNSYYINNRFVEYGGRASNINLAITNGRFYLNYVASGKSFTFTGKEVGNTTSNMRTYEVDYVDGEKLATTINLYLSPSWLPGTYSAYIDTTGPSNWDRLPGTKLLSNLSATLRKF